jgi:hypothetical protein
VTGRPEDGPGAGTRAAEIKVAATGTVAAKVGGSKVAEIKVAGTRAAEIKVAATGTVAKVARLLGDDEATARIGESR